jgi:decaprenylphospho-beta-D-ribofuranose 2-oxidase
METSLENVDGWGLSTASLCHVARPQNMEEVAAAFALARERGWSVGLRGAGRSYGDASQNEGALLIDMQAVNRIHDWDPETGIARVDPGVTVEGLWEKVVVDGWWPKVVSGTMTPTIGGAAAMNIHGKNAWKVGTIGDHIQSFRLLTPNGDELDCSREENSELFHGAIGGFGELGVMHDITIKNQFVDSGRVMEYPYVVSDLDAMFDKFEELTTDFDYCVGWIDSFATGSSLGRGQIHTARYLSAREDPEGMSRRAPENQRLSESLLGFPKRHLWRFVRPFAFPLGMRAINLAKVIAGTYMPGANRPYLQSHAGFHFLLDFIPDWKLMHGSGGLIQWQPFVPADKARSVFRRLLTMQQDRGLVNWLTVMKRHRPDPFLLTHGLDGWSLAQDFNVTDANRQRLWQLCHDMTEVVLEAGGRFYPAKDATLTARQFQRSLGQDRLSAFRALKQQVDPQGILQTNLSRRLMS